MKRGIVITIAITLFAAIVAGFLLLRSPRKPVVAYQGKTAEQWLGEIFTTNQTVAMMAFRQMGTNAFPVLLDAFKIKDTAWSKAYGVFYRKMPASWQGHLARPVPPQELWSAAHLVLINNQAARTRAKSLLPELARLLEDKSIISRNFLVSVICSSVQESDEQCVPGLITCIGEGDPGMRFEAVHGLGQIGPSAKAVVPAITSALADSDVEVRLSAAWALWRINHETNRSVPVLRKVLTDEETLATSFGQPEPRFMAVVYLHDINSRDLLLIPALINELQSQDNNARNIAIMFLGDYGSSASAAVPALTTVLNSRDHHLRQRALDALKKIDPETAAKYNGK